MIRKEINEIETMKAMEKMTETKADSCNNKLLLLKL